MNNSKIRCATFALSVLLLAGGVQAQQTANPVVVAPGAPKSGTTEILETGAKILQSNSPVKGFDIYLVGFHPMKEHPEMQMESHHYCHQMNEDFAQCVLFNGNTGNASMNGMEYIISEKLFASLPVQERRYWHPHNGEILSGQLVAPALPNVAEHALMKEKMNSYGKTWHVWNTGHDGAPGDKLPLGEPMLAWSFNRDGEAMAGLVESRDRRMKIDTSKKRHNRTNLAAIAKPQSGVDDLKDKFGRPAIDIPGVLDQKANAAAPTSPVAR
ncbi:MAG: OBAP family protein [Herminiimonas sp.]|nr:OBAP family protein [Herminiimonas sp.]